MRFTKRTALRTAVAGLFALLPALFVLPANAAQTTGTAAPMTNYGYYLPKGGTLYDGDYIQAYIQYDDGELDRLIMQPDGNLVYYNYYEGQRVCFATGTNGHPGAYAVFQSNGYLIVESETGVPLWSTARSGNPGTTLSINSTTGSLFAGDYQLSGAC